MHRTHRTLSLIAISVLGVRASTPAFSPADGSSLTKQYTTELKVECSDAQATLDGAAFPLPLMQLDSTWTRTLTVEDQYVSCADGRPLELVRRFDDIDFQADFELTLDIEGTTGTGDAQGTNSLVGRSVRFAWDEEDEIYSKSLADADGEQIDLAPVDEDMDLRCVLPSDEVVPGDKWDIDPDLFLKTMVPGGSLPLTVQLTLPPVDPRFALAGFSPMTAISGWMGGEVRGDVQATLIDVDKELSVARIQIDVDFVLEKDALQTMEARWGNDPMPGASASLNTATFTNEVNGEGELYWDLKAGHLRSYEFEAEMLYTVAEEFVLTVDGASSEVSSELEFEGAFRQNIVVE